MKRDEGGYIVVETITCFTLFVFLMMSILSLINIVTVQARVHYAITQAAETISMYSYTLDAMGVAEHLMKSAGQAGSVDKEKNEFVKNVNDVFDAVENLNVSGIQSSGEALYNQGANLAQRVENDPKSLLQELMNYGLQKGGSAVFGALVRPLVGRYLTNGSTSGDEFLKAFRVKDGLDGLEFSTFNIIGWDAENHRLQSSPRDDSMLLTSEGDIRIVVSYEIDYTFGTLPLPFGELTVTQEVVTKAWLGGAGEGYPRK
ncbi:MAG: hypothetical protein HFG05_05090 [Oscillibacter sp.]|nr:hypothetical protein [Oscillibacter sp.]